MQKGDDKQNESLEEKERGKERIWVQVIESTVSWTIVFKKQGSVERKDEEMK